MTALQELNQIIEEEAGELGVKLFVDHMNYLDKIGFYEPISDDWKCTHKFSTGKELP